MTFIASVIAKNGVAIIADSLVTTTIPSIQFSEFQKFLKEKTNKTKSDEIKLSPEEVIGLFKHRPSYTKDYEDKLFKLDDFTVITTAGSASINGKRINILIEELKQVIKNDKNYNRKSIKTRVKIFCDYFEQEVKIHLQTKSSIRPTKFIYTYFDKNKKITQIYKIRINSASQKDLEKESFKFVSVNKAKNWEKVICDGQNRISERILFGTIDDIYMITPKIINKVLTDFKININEKELSDYIKKLMSDKTIISPEIFDGMKIFKLSELSLQQAVDLATLLMKIEMDFQIYTENIPTVGGVIKLAVIDKNGFKYISGDEIVKHI